VAPLARLLRRAASIALLMAVPLSAVHAQAQKPSEYQVKAAYLYGFGKFVEWPTNAPSVSAKNFVVCILGPDPFGRSLDDVAAGAVIKDVPIQVLHISQLDESAPCHTLFISALEEVRLGKVLEALERRPVLTVSDVPQFAQRGGMIGFSLDGGRVRFTVNLLAAQDAGLTLNSELLRVAAAIVRVRQPGNQR
jgi:hypothetical protein